MSGFALLTLNKIANEEAVPERVEPTNINVYCIRAFYARRGGKPGTRITFNDGGGFAVAEPVDYVRRAALLVAKGEPQPPPSAANEAAPTGGNSAPPTGATVPRNRAKPGTQSHMIGEMLLRPSGVTQSEILEVTGGRSRHVPSRARVCGIEITSQRMGRQIRYFAVERT
jgi:hypothetical protein